MSEKRYGMSIPIVGLDIGKDQLEVVLLRPEQPPEQAQFANTPKGFGQVWRFLKKRQAQQAHVCMEATGLYYEQIADFLYEQGLKVSVVNPARIKAYAQSQLSRNKTDKLDALTIADFCQRQQPPRWTPPTPAWRHLRALVRHLDDLQPDLQRQRNRLHARQYASQPVATVTDHLHAHIELLQRQVKQVKQAIAEHIDQQPDLKADRALMASISGMGDLTASKLLAEIPDIRLFDDVRQLVAVAGLNPRHHQSGTSIRGKTPISKMGHASLRATLYMPAGVAKTHNPVLRAFAQRLEQHDLHGMEIIVVVMRKLLHLVYGILKSGQPFDPQYLEQTGVAP
ncbi:MAG: IS110 family transposase [Chloroflexi bacterium]|nr:IS110 family transposase [Chloroflexota bacterium]